MADKPKTYAQQVQELKDQLQQKDEQLNDALQRLSFVEEMQGEIAHLREQLAFDNKAGQQATVSNKAQLTDTLQRAESAEQGLRNAQNKIQALEHLKEQLESQLNVMAMEVDRTVSKAKTIVGLEEHIKAQNLKIANLQQQLRDLQIETNESSAKQEKEVIYLRQLAKAQAVRLADIEAAVKTMPDSISALKGMVNRW